MQGSTGAFYFFIVLLVHLKIFYSIFEKKNFLSEIGYKHRDKLNEKSSNQIVILLPIANNCNNQNKIPTSLNFSWHESKICNLILVKILHIIKCLFEVLKLNTSNNTFHFDFSIVLESSDQTVILLPIANNCNDQKKILTSLNFSWHESKICNLILVKILHIIKCLFEVLKLNTSNNTFHFDFSIVLAILKNLTSNLIRLSHLLILKTVHTRIPEGNNAPV